MAGLQCSSPKLWVIQNPSKALAFPKYPSIVALLVFFEDVMFNSFILKKKNLKVNPTVESSVLPTRVLENYSETQIFISKLFWL